MPIGRKVRYGMVGGGPGAFIGEVHRMAAALDGEIELVAGAFSPTTAKLWNKARRFTSILSVSMDLSRRWLKRKASFLEGERIDFVSIVTPNHMHFPGCEGLY